MIADTISHRFRALAQTHLQRPGNGATAQRHHAILEAGREDLSLAKLIEAHWDAVAILEEAGQDVVPGSAYAVWASELPGQPLVFGHNTLQGVKHFCSGATLVDRALVSTGNTLVEIDLHAAREYLHVDHSGWHTEAFGPTQTASITFTACPVVAVIGTDNWYTERPGFWQGACGPAAAWAGGAAGLLDYAMKQKRDDAHTLAHLGAMHANVSAMQAILSVAGGAFDREPQRNAMTEALEVRHSIEQLCTDTLRRFARALGPAPLVKDEAMVRRYAELDLFLRQSHAERDLEALGRALRNATLEEPTASASPQQTSLLAAGTTLPQARLS